MLDCKEYTSMDAWNGFQHKSSTIHLIQLVKERPVLWDRNCEVYRDRHLKEDAWKQIYRLIEPTYENASNQMKQRVGNQITKKWYNVRDCYTKFRKNNISGQGTSQRRKPYVYSDLLSFLEPIYSEENDSQVESFGDDNYNEDNNSNYDESEIYLDLEEPAIEIETVKRKKPKESNKAEEENIVAVLANLIKKEEDEDRAFFKSITPHVKSLSEESKFEFQIQTMNLLKELKQNDKKRRKMTIKTERMSESDASSSDVLNC